MNTSNILNNSNFRNYLIFIFSFLPIAIIIGNAVMEFNILLIIVSFIIYIFANNSVLKNLKKEYFLYWLLFLWGYLILNSFLGVDFSNSIRRNFLFFKFILLIISFKYLLSHFDILKKIIFCWAIIILIVCLDVQFEFIFGYNVLGFESPMKNERVVSFFKDELIVGSFLFAFLFIIVGSLMLDNKFKLAFIIGLIISLSIFLTGERSIIFKLIFSFFLFVFFIQASNKVRIFSIILFLLMISSLLSIDRIKFRYVDTIKNSLNIENQNIEQKLLSTKYLNQSVFAFEILKQNIFFGIGNKNYHKECINLKENSNNQNIINMSDNCYTHPHQVWYEFFTEHGFVGTFIIFLVMYRLLLSKNKFQFFDNKKKTIIIFKIYCLSSLLPIIPTGSFFSSLNLAFFFINFSIYTIILEKYNKNNQ